MSENRPRAADKVFDFLDGALDTEDQWDVVAGLNLPEGLVVALREAVGAGPDAIVCLLPDGTLSVAEPSTRRCSNPAHDAWPWHSPAEFNCSFLYRIGGAA